MSRFSQSRRRALAAAGLLVVLLFGGMLWWLGHPPVPWERLTAQAKPLAWEGEGNEAGRAALLAAWVLAATPPDGEIWVQALPADTPLEAPPGWQILGASRVTTSATAIDEQIWLKAPAKSTPEQAGRQLLRALQRAGWEEPGEERLNRRLATLPPPLRHRLTRFLRQPMPADAAPSILLCQDHGQARANLTLVQQQGARLIAYLQIHRGSPPIGGCNSLLRALLSLTPVTMPGPLPGVVKMPTLKPPPDAQPVAISGPAPLEAAFISHIVLKTSRSPTALRRWFDDQMRAQHWQAVQTQDGTHIAWSAWQRRSLGGHRYQARLFVWENRQGWRTVALLLLPQRSFPKQAEVPAATLRIHGDLTSPAGQALASAWLLSMGNGRARFRLSPGKLPLAPLNSLPLLQPLGRVHITYHFPLSGSPEEEWLALTPRPAEGAPQMLPALNAALQQAGWQPLPIERAGGWGSLVRPPFNAPRAHWCQPQYGDELTLWIHPWATPIKRLLDFRVHPGPGGMGCKEAFDASDPVYLLNQHLPHWAGLSTYAAVRVTGVNFRGSMTPLGHNAAISQYAWVWPAGDIAALVKALEQATTGQGWQRTAAWSENHAYWSQWRHQPTPSNMSPIQMNIALFPLDDGHTWLATLTAAGISIP